jgi:N-acyl-D-aspartate/D-glutamate deacylase
MRVIFYVLASLVIVVGQSTAQSVPPELIRYPDLVLYNGNVLTADKNFTVAEAVAVRDGKILAVGSNKEIEQLAGPSTQSIDLRGRSVTP